MKSVFRFHGMGIIHTAKKNIVSELIRKKKQLKMEYIARMEQRPRELTTAEKLEVSFFNEPYHRSMQDTRWQKNVYITLMIHLFFFYLNVKISYLYKLEPRETTFTLHVQNTSLKFSAKQLAVSIESS